MHALLLRAEASTEGQVAGVGHTDAEEDQADRPAGHMPQSHGVINDRRNGIPRLLKQRAQGRTARRRPVLAGMIDDQHSRATMAACSSCVIRAGRGRGPPAGRV